MKNDKLVFDDYFLVEDKEIEELGNLMILREIHSAMIDELKIKILAKHDQDKVSNGKVFITKTIKKGAIPYSKIQEVQELDLEQYRGKEVETITVRLKK